MTIVLSKIVAWSLHGYYLLNLVDGRDRRGDLVAQINVLLRGHGHFCRVLSVKLANYSYIDYLKNTVMF